MFLPWTLVSAAAVIHSGGIRAIHLLWSLGVDLVLIGCLGV